MGRQINRKNCSVFFSIGEDRCYYENGKNSKRHIYLAKIYKTEENEKKEEKNINTVLLLEPNNEEAMYMLIDLKLKTSDYNRVKELTEKLEIICSSFCDKIDLINERLTNIEAKDES